MTQTHGGDVHRYQARFGSAPLDFSANINPLGMPQAARAAAVDALAQAVHYPDPACTLLRGAIATQEGISTDWLLCGNGAADLIYRFAYAAGAQAGLVCAPSFGEYAQAMKAAGTAVRRHPLHEAEGFRVTAAILPALEGVQTLYLCNPNNPTGQTIAPEVLTAILNACAARQIRVLLDECFTGFLDDPASAARTRELARYPNLVILRAFTKLYAMPGLRLGYALCADARLLARMEAAGPPWSVSTVAQAAGVAALSEPGYRDRTRALIRAERGYLRQRLSQLGLTACGEANFLLFKAAPGLPDMLLREGIMVRDCANFEGLGEGWVRIAVRTRTENDRLLAALKRYLHG